MPEPSAQFITPLILEDIDGRHMRLVRPLRFYSAELRGTLVVPAGMVTDFASIPRGLWNVFPKNGKWDRPSCVHDAGYRGALRTPAGQRVRLIRPLVDKLFLEGMKAEGVNACTRRLMYLAVRAFGAKAYDERQSYVETSTQDHRGDAA